MRQTDTPWEVQCQIGNDGMNILYITPSFHHPQLRGPSRHYYLIRELSRRHHITLLSFTRTPVPDAALADVGGHTDRVLLFDASTPACSALVRAIARVPRIGRAIAEMLGRQRTLSVMRDEFRRLASGGSFDLVLFHGKPVFRVIDGWNRLPIVADFCDATSMRYAARLRKAPLLQRPLVALRYLRVRQVERKLLDKTPHQAFVSNRDRQAILGSDTDARVIPLGIDLEYWTRSSTVPEERCLLFTGVMDYRPNTDAAIRLIDRILPRVQRSMPDVRLVIAGRNPTPDLLQRAQNRSDVTVTGFVEDLRPYLERATVFVAPIKEASGTQTKVIEALAMKVPVVTTPQVCDGLRVDDVPPPVRQPSSDSRFAEQILDLLERPEERGRLAALGRQYVEARFDWQQSARVLEEMFDAALSA